MSLVRIALRIAAIQALKGQTLVGNNVLDSEIGTLQVDADGAVRTDEDAPFITVYTDAATTRGMDIGSRPMVINGATEVLFEAGITAAMTETDPDTDETRLIGIGTPATDQGFEFHLDMVSRQIADALNNPDNAWSDIYRSLIFSISQIDRARTANSAEGLRIAGHQIKVTATLISDPVRGEALKSAHPLAVFFAKAAALDDPVVANQIAIMQQQLSGEVLPWNAAIRRHGLTRAEAEALLIDPPSGNADIAISEIVVAPATPADPTP